MIVKFNSQPADYITQDVLSDINGVVTMGFRIFISGIGDIRLSNGDYIVVDDNGGVVEYYSASQYDSDLVVKTIIREYIGKDLIRNIWTALLASSLTDAQKVGVANKIAVVLVMIQCAEIVAGRFLANTITTDANFTVGVKTALLDLMDEQIAKL